MKKEFFKSILFPVLLLVCVSINAKAQTIVAESKLQSYTIKIGEQTKLFLIVHQPVKEHVNFPKLLDTITGKVQVAGANKPDTSIDQNDHNRITVTRSYNITSFDAGTYTIPPFDFGAGIAKTNELTLQVQTVKVDTTKSIYDIKQPLVVSYTFFDWLRDHWVWVVIGLVIVGLIVWLIYYLKSRPKNEPVIKIVKPVIPIHTIAINKLRELRAKKLWQQNEVKQYYIEISDIIREYLEKRYDIKTQEKTTDEILTSLKYRDITDEYSNVLNQVLTLSDLVKFAKEKPSPVENEQSIDDAITFVLKTQLDAGPEKNIEGGIDELA
ncbi:MAG: hypothetical protein JWQ79_1054 [Mucilaginibacter sp.]|nr:hypothetical protein [Mucilaginibacter sp.]